MNYPFTLSGQVPAAADLAEAVADRYGCVGVISRSATGTAALLDQTAQELSSRRIRCVRVQGRASGGLASRDLIAQIVARPGPGALSDADLKAGFMALTEPGEGFRRVALLVSEAHSLLPSALRYIQLARQSTPARLCLVLAGQPGLLTALEGEDFAALRSAVHMIEVAEPAGHDLFDKASAVSALPVAPRRRGGSATLARLGLAAMVVPVVGLIWWRHLPPSSTEAVPSLDAPGVPAAMEPPVPLAAEPPAAAPAARLDAPVPSAPSPAPLPLAEGSPSTEPAPPLAALPGPPVAETETPEPPQNSVSEAAPPPAAEPPAAEPSTPPAAPERSGAPTGEASAAAEPAPPKPAPPKPAPEAGPPPPDPASETKPPASPPPHGSVTVTAALPAHGGTRRAAPSVIPPASAPPITAPAAASARAVEQPSLTDARRCRDIVLRAQLGQNPSDEDKQFLRGGCRGS